MTGNKLFKNKDLIPIGIALVAALVFIILFPMISAQNNSNQDIIATIKQDNNEIHKINLKDVNEPYYIDVDGEYHSHILVEPGQICFEKADCPDNVCVNTGKISKPGQIAVCLPAKLIIEIAGKDVDVDRVTG